MAENRPYNPKQDGKPDFVLNVPNTSTPTANLNYRLEVTLDQAGLWDGGQRINDHQFRVEVRLRSDL